VRIGRSYPIHAIVEWALACTWTVAAVAVSCFVSSVIVAWSPYCYPSCPFAAVDESDAVVAAAVLVVIAIQLDWF